MLRSTTARRADSNGLGRHNLKDANQAVRDGTATGPLKAHNKGRSIKILLYACGNECASDAEDLEAEVDTDANGSSKSERAEELFI